MWQTAAACMQYESADVVVGFTNSAGSSLPLTSDFGPIRGLAPLAHESHSLDCQSSPLRASRNMLFSQNESVTVSGTSVRVLDRRRRSEGVPRLQTSQLCVSACRSYLTRGRLLAIPAFDVLFTGNPHSTRLILQRLNTTNLGRSAAAHER